MSFIAGKTVFITGGSRGIGHAIALKCHKANANVAIVANEEVLLNQFSDKEKILSFNLDIRDVDAIKLAINQTIKHFGGIDVLINNASAFCFSDTLNISSEEFDLLFSVNARATFFVSQLCFPYLKLATNPHIINISPPLDMHPRWFEKHLAFTMSKYGMSMSTLGMAEEFKSYGIAVNSLWPQTTIATKTIETHFIPEVYIGSRWPSIMADAAYVLMQKNSRECTGNFFIDEELLREEGINNFTQYAVDPEAPLIQDLFIPEKNNNKMPLKKDFYKIG